VVVDLSRLARIGPVGVDQRRVRVEAGVVLGTLNRHLAPHGLFLPVIPGSHRAASIGGMIATDAAGLRAVRYGTMRDWVAAVTLVDGRGQLQHLSGKRLADVAGRE
jgi:FAD/FMN-containing dehydrogenase